ncbi:PTS glucitol/sorbitol transporter subunit IIA [Lactobacillus sp. ESL0703]|uniref:PTS glucitol/sorbitol transporter subunit IIA n=1 Tax=Lactobacillus sp. ESL0703 TaxID=2983218 RepID=UPI0023F95DEE|nr:PTS glucitol/sorbitol transporter subunit IIA [Lactobacillus sp. ESL0703]MDF7669391.1 PTS glucitol/sorbitol transporter subunit IIA [Lactobacillus sp. ESL0703]
MKWISTITQIGQQAIKPEDKMVILFGENVTKGLVDVSVLQKFGSQTPASTFVFKKGDTITIDGQTYVASFVGSMVESNMRVLGHATLFFDQKKLQNPLANGIYLELGTKQTLPEFRVDDDIVYEHR